MAPDPKRAILYAQHMRFWDCGYALCKPKSNAIVKPGGAGYFDELGEWNPIADLTDGAGLERNGFKLPETLTAAPLEDNIEWGPRNSEHVTGTDVGVDAEAK